MTMKLWIDELDEGGPADMAPMCALCKEPAVIVRMSEFEMVHFCDRCANGL